MSETKILSRKDFLRIVWSGEDEMPSLDRNALDLTDLGQRDRITELEASETKLQSLYAAQFQINVERSTEIASLRLHLSEAERLMRLLLTTPAGESTAPVFTEIADLLKSR